MKTRQLLALLTTLCLFVLVDAQKLDESLFDDRYLTVVRFSGLSMSNHAKERNAFRGPASDFFISNLVDLLAGIFTAEVSSETRALVGKRKLK